MFKAITLQIAVCILTDRFITHHTAIPIACYEPTGVEVAVTIPRTLCVIQSLICLSQEEAGGYICHKAVVVIKIHIILPSAHFHILPVEFNLQPPYPTSVILISPASQLQKWQDHIYSPVSAPHSISQCLQLFSLLLGEGK